MQLKLYFPSLLLTNLYLFEFCRMTAGRAFAASVVVSDVGWWVTGGVDSAGELLDSTLVEFEFYVMLKVSFVVFKGDC